MNKRIKLYTIFFLVIVVFLTGWFVYGIDYITVNDRTWERERSSVEGDTSEEQPAGSNDDSTITTEETIEEGTEPVVQDLILLEGVPFTPQAPLANWDDPRQQDGCEEAAALMAMRWVEGRGLTLEEAEREIIAASEYQTEHYGEYRDTSAADTAERIFRGYFNYQNVEVVYDITVTDIIKELVRGNLVIVPTDGRLLGNPYFTPPGPERHMFPVIGYDHRTGEFITQENGTRRGESYRYDENVLINAVRDYPSGDQAPIEEERKAMIVVSK